MTAYKKHRLTTKELKPIAEYYHRALAGWRLLDVGRVVREAGPIVQAITFERLSWGAYRPVGHLVTLVIPEGIWAFEVGQHLNIKVQTIERRAHDSMKEQVLAAIEREFRPDVHLPLDPEDALTLYERETVPTSPEAYALAALHAYQGHDERALYWCARFPKLVEEKAMPWADYDRSRKAFLDSLVQWIKHGDARERLDEIRKAQRVNFGLDCNA